MAGLEAPTAWGLLLEPVAAPLLGAVAALADPEAPSPAELTRLRRLGPAELVPYALELAAARRRAAHKLESAATLLADRAGVEQASGTRVARHKARRFAALAPSRLVDLCSGIGGDAIEFAAALPQTELLAVDLDPSRARMTEHNARCRAAVADVESIELGSAAFHCDPARRDERLGTRSWRLADHRPGPSFLAQLAVRGAAGAIKLGPGLALDATPLLAEGELEFVSDHGCLVQALLWCGPLARGRGQRSATRLAKDATGAELVATGSPRRLDRVAERIARFLCVPDPALERAGLVAQRAASFDGAELAAGLGLVGAETDPADPWFAIYEVLEQMPWREERLRDALRAHDAGLVTVRTRDAAVDCDRAARALRGTGDVKLDVFGLRLGRRIVALITRQVARR